MAGWRRSLRETKGALALATALVATGVMLALLLGRVAQGVQAQSAPWSPSQGAAATGSHPSSHPAPAAPTPAARKLPAATVLPTPTPQVLAGRRVMVSPEAPSADDPRAVVRAARAGRPLAHRPVSVRQEPSPVPQEEWQGLGTPVPGRWRVSCGYRCNLHTGVHTFALDLVRMDAPTAGTPVFSPVEGEVVAMSVGTVADCPTGTVRGAQAGATLVIRFWQGEREMRLRLIHLDPDTVPMPLRQQGAHVSVGTYVGSLAFIAPGCAHLHLALTTVEGTLERPMPLTIGGRHLPDCLGVDCWTGLELSWP
jgi:hypothetical protein